MADEKTSKDVAGKAARVLADPNASADEKSVAASALSQTADKPAPAPKTQAAIPDTSPKKLLRFRANEKSPSIDIQQGEYHRFFRVEDQPFECETEEEFQMLRNTGHFVEDKEAEREAKEQEAES